MTPADLKAIGEKLFGRKKWQTSLATALNVNPSTIFRMMHRPRVPGPYVVALNSLVENKRRMDEVTKEARRLLRDRKRLEKAKQGDKPRGKRKKAEPPVEPAEPLQVFDEGDSE